jgi:diaminohydroxyphosphoribosylaminopyrimidine deaminase/5-amino-6-(5-phosphoribosylamino)uracil reductase
MKDPNPNVIGGGCACLRGHGLEITEGVLESEARELNETFIKYSRTKKPFVTLKSAITLDGWCATSAGHSKWVTSERSRVHVHRLRARSDAVLVGVGTVIADDPLLTVRGVRGRNPLRIVVDTSLRTPADARVVRDLSDARTLLAVGPGVKAERMRKMTGQRVEVVNCPVVAGRIDLAALLERLGEMSVTSLLVEGGAEIAGAFLRESLVDKVVVFLAPKLLAGDDGVPMARGPGASLMDHCLRLKDIRVRKIGGDIMVIGYPACAGATWQDKQR